MSNPGWSGKELSLELQTLVMVKYFESSLRQILQSVAFAHKDLFKTLEESDNKIEALSENPLFLQMMSRFQGSLGFEKYGDRSFRLDSDAISKEARDELLDMLVYVCIMMWVNDGATFPDWLIEEAEAAAVIDEDYEFQLRRDAEDELDNLDEEE